MSREETVRCISQGERGQEGHPSGSRHGVPTDSEEQGPKRQILESVGPRWVNVGTWGG